MSNQLILHYLGRENGRLKMWDYAAAVYMIGFR